MMPGERSLPPEVQAAVAQAREHQRLAGEMQASDRRDVIRLAAILCSCDHRYAPGLPSIYGCMVHGAFMITADGDVL